MREFLERIARESDDPDTQTACVIVTADGRIVYSANELPAGVSVEEKSLERPLKYSYIQHAERRAIDKAACSGERLSGSTIFLDWFPCAQCAGSIVTAGIVLVVAGREKYEARKDDPRYGFAEAADILSRGGVEVRWLE